MTATTWNSGDKDADITLSGGDLTATQSNASIGLVRSTFSNNSGRYYFEITYGDTATQLLGICTSGHSVDKRPGLDTGAGNEGVGYQDGNGNLSVDGSTGAYGPTFTNGDVIGIALDLDSTNRAIWFSKNGDWTTTFGATIAEIEAFDTTNAGATWTATRTLFAANGFSATGSDSTVNFGATALVV